MMVSGDKEKTLHNRTTKEREEVKRAKEIIAKVIEKESMDLHIEEVYRIRKNVLQWREQAHKSEV